jgi:hypothetical protein
MDQFHVILVMPSYGLIPVPPHLRHLTILSPFLRVPFPSQFLHGFFFSPALFRISSSKFNSRYQSLYISIAIQHHFAAHPREKEVRD